MSPNGEAGGHRTACYLCGRPTYDPDKRSRPWLRAASGGRQVLVCPTCQEERPGFAGELDRCERCGAVRLSVMLGEVVCRACGAIQGDGGGSDEVPPTVEVQSIADVPPAEAPEHDAMAEISPVPGFERGA